MDHLIQVHKYYLSNHALDQFRIIELIFRYIILHIVFSYYIIWLYTYQFDFMHPLTK